MKKLFFSFLFLQCLSIFSVEVDSCQINANQKKDFDLQERDLIEKAQKEVEEYLNICRDALQSYENKFERDASLLKKFNDYMLFLLNSGLLKLINIDPKEDDVISGLVECYNKFIEKTDEEDLNKFEIDTINLDEYE